MASDSEEVYSHRSLGGLKKCSHGVGDASEDPFIFKFGQSIASHGLLGLAMQPDGSLGACIQGTDEAEGLQSGWLPGNGICSLPSGH